MDEFELLVREFVQIQGNINNFKLINVKYISGLRWIFNLKIENGPSESAFHWGESMRWYWELDLIQSYSNKDWITYVGYWTELSK